MATDMNGGPVLAGDRIHMPGTPASFAVVVRELVPCEEDCPNGAAAIIDPEGKPDEVCLRQFVKV